MTDAHLDIETTSTPPDFSGGEFGVTADGLVAAKIADDAYVMVPRHGGGFFVASAWRIGRPLGDCTRDDFYSWHEEVSGEAAFRDFVRERVGHRRELDRLERRKTTAAVSTPWGVSQDATLYAEGVVCHSTAGHGGFHLSPDRNLLVASNLRVESGWYEEDCQWAIVALTFPDLFTVWERKCADRTIRDWWPDAWEGLVGRALAPGESWIKDRRAFECEHAGDWVVISALCSSRHIGMVEVVATPGGRRDRHAEERRFLVPSDEYGSNSGRLCFVIDEARHHADAGAFAFAGEQGAGS